VVCPPNLPPVTPARTVQHGTMSFDLPTGRTTWSEAPVNADMVLVCVGYAGVRLSSTDCAEIARAAFTPDEHALLDAIVASCRVS